MAIVKCIKSYLRVSVVSCAAPIDVNHAASIVGVKAETHDVPCQPLTSAPSLSPDQHLGELHQVGVAEAAPAPSAALRVKVGAAVVVLTTLSVTLTLEAGVIGLVTLASTGAVTLRNIK